MGIRIKNNIKIVRRETAKSEISTVVEEKKELFPEVKFSEAILGYKTGTTGQIKQIFIENYPYVFDESTAYYKLSRALDAGILQAETSIIQQHALSSKDFEIAQKNIQHLGHGKKSWILKYDDVNLAFSQNDKHVQIVLAAAESKNDFMAIVDIEKLPNDDIEIKFVKNGKDYMYDPVQKLLRLGAWSIFAKPELLLAMSKL